MVVLYDRENDEYYIKERIDNQTVKLVFQMNDWNQDTIFSMFISPYITSAIKLNPMKQKLR